MQTMTPNQYQVVSGFFFLRRFDVEVYAMQETKDSNNVKMINSANNSLIIIFPFFNYIMNFDSLLVFQELD